MINLYTKAFTEVATKRGITKLHFHIEEIEKRDVSVFNGVVQNIGASGEVLLLVEGCYEGFLGSAYSEEIDADNIESLVDNIIQTASVNKQMYVERPVHSLNNLKSDTTSFEVHKVAEELLEAEKAARTTTCNIAVFHIGLSQTGKKITFINSNGESMTDRVNFCTVGAYIMAKNDDNVQTAHCQRLFNDDLPDFKELAVNAAKEASGMLGSKPCAGAKYTAVIRNDAFAALFGAFLPAFYAEKCQSKMSFLMGKDGSEIGSPSFSAHEDPMRIIHRQFDDEGTLSAKKSLIDKGKLVNYFHNISTAATTGDGQKSTANGFRQNYNEGISSAYTNVVVKSGDKNLDELLLGMGDGILITACDGIFAGVNPVSGDFSVISKGYMIRGGQAAEAVSGVTIGGNLYDLLHAVEACGNDSVTILGNTGVVTSPSILLSGIVVSG